MLLGAAVAAGLADARVPAAGGAAWRNCRPRTERLRAAGSGSGPRRRGPAGAPAPSPPAESPSAPRTVKPAINPEDAIAIQRLKLSLADANASIARLESRADEAEAQLQNLRLDNKRLAGSEADLKENLAAANQAVDALQKELKSSRDRVTQVEIAYQKLRDQSGGDAQKIAQLQQLAARAAGYSPAARSLPEQHFAAL